MNQILKNGLAWLLAMALFVACLAVPVGAQDTATSVADSLVFNIDYTDYDGINTVDTVSGTTLWRNEAGALPVTTDRGGMKAADFDNQWNEYPRFESTICDPLAMCEDGVTVTMWVKMNIYTTNAQFFALQKEAPGGDPQRRRGQIRQSGCSRYHEAQNTHHDRNME